MPQYIIDENNLTIADKTFSGSLGAREILPDGEKRGTFRTYTVLVTGNNITFDNCTFENTAGLGKDVGQAIALYLDGDGIVLRDCVIRSDQDTLFLAPLPEREIIPGGFRGPGEGRERTPRTFVFERCRIEGGVDFIFGGATAYFYDCEFVSTSQGFVFAPSTPESTELGFVAENCIFSRADGVPDESCYIARPWRDHAYVSIKGCTLGKHINPAGFHDWDKPSARKTVRFFETDSRGPGARGKRADFVNRVNKIK